MTNIEYVLSNLESSLASNQTRIANFAVEVQANPAHALIWAMDTFSAGAEIKVLTEVINALKDGCSLKAAIETCDQRALWGARHPARSTSVTSNLFEQEMVVAWVKSPLRGSYTEGGSITHDGIKYNADAVFAIAENKPVYREHVKNLEWVLEYDTPDPARVAKADTSVPVIVALSKNGRPTVIDGLHRLAKAKTAGTEKLPVKFIERSELQRALPVGNAYSEKNLERLFDYDISLALEQDASSSGAQIIALTTKNKQLAELSNVVPTAYKKRLYDEIAAATF